MSKKIVLASNNRKKLKELLDLLSPLGIEVIAQGTLGVPPVEEPFETFLENSLAKARHASEITGLPAIADDSGICVDALKGQPGVHSARLAGKPTDDEKNNAKLLELLKDKKDRTAHYTCVLTAIRGVDDPEPLVAVGRWYGTVSDQRAGERGFGYDPYFVPEGFTKHAAELTAKEKNKVSHRGRAMKEMTTLIVARWGW